MECQKWYIFRKDVRKKRQKNLKHEGLIESKQYNGSYESSLLIITLDIIRLIFQSKNLELQQQMVLQPHHIYYLEESPKTLGNGKTNSESVKLYHVNLNFYCYTNIKQSQFKSRVVTRD